jgi:hypothetical protein
MAIIELLSLLMSIRTDETATAAKRDAAAKEPLCCVAVEL